MSFTLVQSAQGSFASGTTLDVNFGVNTTAGNIIIAAISQSSATDVISSVIQTGASFAGATRNTNSRPAEHWGAFGITGGQTLVRFTLTGSLFGFVICTIMEFSWSGGSTSGFTFDTTTPANTGGTPVSNVCQLGTYTYTTPSVEAIALASIRYNAAYVSGPDNGWNRVSGADNRSEAGYLFVASTSGTTTTAWTTANSTGTFGGQITAIYAPGGGVAAPTNGLLYPMNPVPRRPGPGGLTGGVPFAFSNANALIDVAVPFGGPFPYRMMIPMRMGPGGFARGTPMRLSSTAPAAPVPPSTGTNQWFPDEDADFF